MGIKDNIRMLADVSEAVYKQTYDRTLQKMRDRTAERQRKKEERKAKKNRKAEESTETAQEREE